MEWGPFFESPGNLMDPKPHRIVVRVLAQKPAHSIWFPDIYVDF